MLKEFSKEMGYILDKYKVGFLTKKEDRVSEEEEE